MKVKAVIGFAGIGFSASVGEVIDLPADVAKPIIESGMAVDAEPKAEQATKATKKVKK